MNRSKDQLAGSGTSDDKPLAVYKVFLSELAGLVLWQLTVHVQ